MMRNIGATVALLVVGLAASGGLMAADMPGMATMAGITGGNNGLAMTVDGLRSTRGMVRVCLTRQPAHFPDCTDDPDSRRLSFAAADAARGVALGQVVAGDYAIAIIHDENSNRRLDTFAGIPREGVGFSRNPAIRFGAPSFRAAQFPVGGANAQVRQEIHIKYFL